MAKPKRPDPLSQGSLKNIYNWFFKPLMLYRPENIEVKDWADMLFHMKHRDITQYKAKVAFKMPGLLYVAPQVKIQGLGYRTVDIDTKVMVRHDIRDTYRDVEFFGGPGGEDQVFQLTEFEWNDIRPHLEEMEVKGLRK